VGCTKNSRKGGSAIDLLSSGGWGKVFPTPYCRGGEEDHRKGIRNQRRVVLSGSEEKGNRNNVFT